MTEKEMRERISPKVEEAAEQYRRAELFWYCSTMSDEEIAKRRRAFVTSYEKELKEFFDAIFPGGTHSAPGEEEKKYLEKTGLASIMEEYRTVEEEKSKVRQPKESLGKMDPAESDTLSDPTITEEQREGLRQFHQWLYRNCDRKGIKYFGEKLFGSDGSARNFADKFMSQPASVQLKALYLLENDKRKIPDTSGQFNVESQVDYVPNLDRLKDKMTATKWKFWKRTNGSYLYWHKLNESLEAANEDREALLKYRKEANERYQKDPEEYKKTRTIQALLSFSGKLEEKNQEKDKEDGNSGVDLVSNATDRILNPYYAVDYVQSGSIDVEGISTGTSSDDLDGYVSRFLKSVGSEKLASHYDKISTLGLESVAVVSGLLSMYSGGKELAAMRGVSSTLENAQAVAGIGTDTMYTAQSVTSITETIGEYVKASEEFASTIGTAGTAIFGGVNLLIAAKGGIGYLSSQRNEKHAKRAKKLGEELKDKKLQDRAEFARYLSEKKKHKGIREFIQGSAGVTSAAISLFASAVPVAGQVAGVIAVSMALYEGYVKANENLQEKYRKGIDTELFDGGKDLEKRDTDFKKQLQERIRKFPEGSAQRKKLEELCRDKNKEKRYDILRKEEAVRRDCVFLRDCYEKVIGAMGEEAYRNVFYIDPKKGGSYENLITKENQEKYFTPQKIEDSDTAEVKANKEEHNRQVLIRTSYKELMKSFGTKTEFESEEKLIRDLKKKEKGKNALSSVRETMEQKAEEKRKKVMDAFTKA